MYNNWTTLCIVGDAKGAEGGSLGSDEPHRAEYTLTRISATTDRPREVSQNLVNCHTTVVKASKLYTVQFL